MTGGTDPVPLAVVTGGAQGIGRALTEHLLGEGRRVVALDLDAEAVAELLETHAGGGALLALETDVGDGEAVNAAFGTIAGWQRDDGQPGGLDLLVNNAGLADPVSGPLEALSESGWRRWLGSHLDGAFFASRAAIPGLRERRGAIVNISSTRALQSEPDCEAYAAANGGLLAMTHALAISLGPEITVNAVCPGWIDTAPWQKASERTHPEFREIDRRQHPVGRIGEPADIVAAVLWFASPQARFVTGQHLAVDGGMTRKMIYAD